MLVNELQHGVRHRGRHVMKNETLDEGGKVNDVGKEIEFAKCFSVGRTR